MTSTKASDTRRCLHLLSDERMCKSCSRAFKHDKKDSPKKERKKVKVFHRIIFPDVFSACMTQPFSYPSLALSSSSRTLQCSSDTQVLLQVGSEMCDGTDDCSSQR